MYVEARATLSADEKYRYSLIRSWDETPGGPRACFIMLNPSTADGEKDDPTIRKCVAFAKQVGCTSLEVVNLFAYRSTNPKVLKTLDEATAVGPENNMHIEAAARTAHVVIAAWGVNGLLFNRSDTVRGMLASVGCRLQALRFTKKTGMPEHPLYIPYGLPLVDEP